MTDTPPPALEAGQRAADYVLRRVIETVEAGNMTKRMLLDWLEKERAALAPAPAAVPVTEEERICDEARAAAETTFAPDAEVEELAAWAECEAIGSSTPDYDRDNFNAVAAALRRMAKEFREAQSWRDDFSHDLSLLEPKLDAAEARIAELTTALREITDRYPPSYGDIDGLLDEVDWMQVRARAALARTGGREP